MGRGHSLCHVIWVLSSVLLPAQCYLGSLIRMCKASDILGSVREFLDVFQNRVQAESAHTISLFIILGLQLLVCTPFPSAR